VGGLYDEDRDEKHDFLVLFQACATLCYAITSHVDRTLVRYRALLSFVFFKPGRLQTGCLPACLPACMPVCLVVAEEGEVKSEE
jgi:hypothetical protein